MLRNKMDHRLKRRLAWVGLVCLGSLALPGGTPSQTQMRPDSGEDSNGEVHCRLESGMEIVDVEVKDVYGWLVSNLSHDQFVVYENGKRQQINFFTSRIKSELGESPKYRLCYYPPQLPIGCWALRRIPVTLR